MRVHGQVSGIAYREPTRILTDAAKRKLTRRASKVRYTVSGRRDVTVGTDGKGNPVIVRQPEDYFRSVETVEQAIAIQAALVAEGGWVVTINPPPPKLKGGKAASPTPGKRMRYVSKPTAVERPVMTPTVDNFPYPPPPPPEPPKRTGPVTCPHCFTIHAGECLGGERRRREFATPLNDGASALTVFLSVLTTE